MALVSSKVFLFNDGEPLLYGDLNGIVNGASQRAWEWPGYSDALAHAPCVTTGDGAAYETLFNNATDMNTMVFCRGAGGQLRWMGGFVMSVGSGFLGIYSANVPPTILSPSMRWIYSTGTSITHAAAPGGQKRYDVITLAIPEAADTPTSRDFKDGSTGAISTTTPNKRMSCVGTLTITPGTPNASPTVPAVAGNVVALVLVNDTSVEQFWDCTQPFGPSVSVVGIPSISSVHVAQWVADPATGELTSNVTNSAAYLFPPTFAGDPTAKLVGIDIEAAGSGSSTYDLVSFYAGSVLQRVALTSLVTIDGSIHNNRIDMRGYPKFTSDTRGPIWANGERWKAGGMAGNSRLLALKIACGVGTDVIRSVRWHFAKG